MRGTEDIIEIVEKTIVNDNNNSQDIIEDQAQFHERDEEEVGMLNKEGEATEDSSDEDVVGVRKKP